MKIEHRISVFVGAVLIAALLPQAAGAVEKGSFKLNSTKDLYLLCATPQDDSNYVAASYECRGFIEATAQYHDAVSDRKHLKRLICYPSGTTIADGRRAFLDWAEKHQDSRKMMEEMPVIGLVRALAEKYPCNNNN